MSIVLLRRGSIASSNESASEEEPTTLLEMQIADGAVLAMPLTEAIVAPVDMTGNHTPTVPVAGVTSIATGPIGGRAYSFSGAADNRIEVPDHALLDVGDVVSMECYYRPTTLTDTRTLMSKHANAYCLRRIDSRLEILKSNVAIICASTITLSDTTHWYHVIATKNGATVKLWIDGVDRTGTVTNATLANNTNAFTVGVDVALSGEMAGDLAYIAVYPTALDSTQVAAHFAAPGPSTSNHFTYSGAFRDVVIPDEVTTLTADLYGAAGGTGTGGAAAGLGGRVYCDVTVTPGEVIRVYVGGQGENGAGTDASTVGGFNGGGSTLEGGGGGGGATDIRRTPYALADRLVVAGGGGAGGGTADANLGGAGGNGGTPDGIDGANGFDGASYSNNTRGKKGTASAGGAGGVGSCVGGAGALGTGGNGCEISGTFKSSGGGGGGRYGGGGGGAGSVGTSGGGGAGGSGLSTGANETLQTGVRSGNGVATLSWAGPVGLRIISSKPYTDVNQMVPRTPTALFGADTTLAEPDDILVWLAFRQGTFVGVAVDGSMTTLYVSGETWKGFGFAWKRWGNVVQGDNHGFRLANTSTENNQMALIIRGLDPIAPFGTPSGDWYQQNGTNPNFPSVTVGVNGGIMFVMHAAASQVDPAISSFNPASYTVDLSAVSAPTHSNLGVFIDASVTAGATGNIDVTPTANGAGGSDSWAAAIPFTKAS